MIRILEIEGGIFKIVMDRPGVTRLKAILSGQDEDGRIALHDQCYDWCVEHKIDMDRWKEGR